MGTYNYSARELADEIDNLLEGLEGDFQPSELEKALGLVAAQHGVHPTPPTPRTEIALGMADVILKKQRARKPYRKNPRRSHD